jgi:hypothetical protein
LTAIESSEAVLKEIPESLLTEEICLNVLNSTSGGYYIGLKDIPARLRTRNVCLSALRFRAEAGLDCVPKELLDDQFFVELIEGGGNLNLVPTDKLTREMCVMYLAHPTHNFDRLTTHMYFSKNILNKIPKEFLTEGFFIETVTKKPQFFQMIDDCHLTLNICKAAVRCSDAAFSLIEDNLMYVPKRFRCEELYLEYIGNDSFRVSKRLEKIPKESRTLRICQKALENCDCRFDLQSLNEIMSILPIELLEDLECLIENKKNQRFLLYGAQQKENVKK